MSPIGAIVVIGVIIWLLIVITGGMSSLGEIATELKAIRIALDSVNRRAESTTVPGLRL